MVVATSNTHPITPVDAETNIVLLMFKDSEERKHIANLLLNMSDESKNRFCIFPKGKEEEAKEFMKIV